MEISIDLKFNLNEKQLIQLIDIYNNKNNHWNDNNLKELIELERKGLISVKFFYGPSIDNGRYFPTEHGRLVVEQHT